EIARSVFDDLSRTLLAGTLPSIGRAFAGQTPQEFRQQLIETRAEFDLQTALTLIASFEGLLRVDFHERVRRRWKDAVSRKMRELAYQAARVRLDEILEVWKIASAAPRHISEFRRLVRFRHWLAHGRYWTLKVGKTPDP